MADTIQPEPKPEHGAEEKRRWNPAMAAAIVGGAAAATAGAVWSARALKRRNAGDGELNAVMETAVTASELAHGGDGKGR